MAGPAMRAAGEPVPADGHAGPSREGEIRPPRVEFRMKPASDDDSLASAAHGVVGTTIADGLMSGDKDGEDEEEAGGRTAASGGACSDFLH